MTSSDTAPAKINPDPTKWRDRVIEFGSGAVCGARATGLVLATGIGAAAGAADFASFKTGVVGAACFLFAAYLVGSGEDDAAPDLINPVGSPVQWRRSAFNLGFVFSILSTFGGVGALVSRASDAEPSPAARVSTSPRVDFNATGQDCESLRVKDGTDQAKAQVFSVAAAKLSL